HRRAPPPPRALVLPALPRGSEPVLLVEDEEGVRDLNRQVLQLCGYTVLTAGDGVEALRLSGQHAGPVHLLVTDVLMPQMGGRELSEVLSAQRPGLKVLFLSGYADGEVLGRGALGR